MVIDKKTADTSKVQCSSLEVEEFISIDRHRVNNTAPGHSAQSSVHYNDVIMSAMSSQITSLSIVYPTGYSRRISMKTPKLRVTGLYVGNSPASNAENVSI